MKARVTLTPPLLKKLLDGKPLQFKFPQDANEIEIIVEENAALQRVLLVVAGAIQRIMDKLT